MARDEGKQGRLPIQAIGPGDIKRLRRELEALQNQVETNEGAKTEASPLMAKFGEANELDLSKKADRQAASDFLNGLLDGAPVLHISFSANPSAAFLEKLLTWLRANIHPHTLLTVGLEPSIAAGCILRTPNKQFDLSLRQHFAAQRELLVKQLHLLASQTAAAEPAP